ncbi:acyl-CoA thioester hydrolase/BAAT C-terminal domain-containing protein [Halorientalis pallida]|uniref:acyl-CoA thioester hydrolase/BAAT C-terminal domain-containing protein n=1 Tax=Halorientalis pallida TaxID=2479928 RepID=UPI003C6F95A9
MTDSPRIVVDPARPLVDERFAVRLAGFPPRRRVTLRARMPLDGGLWQSRATVRTDGDGTADLDSQRPLAGTYGTADAMGLVWSAERIGDRPAPRERTRTDGNVSLTATVGGRRVASATVERRFQRADVTAEPVDHRDLVARLYDPPDETTDGDGQRPGILLLGGSSGGFPSRRVATLLASRGYAVLALAYFGRDDLPDRLVEVPLEYVESAVEWLAARDRVRPDPLGVVGWSRGGELALLAATRCDRLRTAVGYAPSTVSFQGNRLLSDPGSAWTVDGEGVPYVPLARPTGFRSRIVARWLRGRPLSVRPLFERGLVRASEKRVRAATIPVEEIGGPVLLVTGGDDRVWPADTLATRAMARLDARSYPHTYDHLSVSGAGHDIKVPYHPTTERATRPVPVPGRSLALDMGGTPAGYARADAQAWERTLEVLDEGLRP